MMNLRLSPGDACAGPNFCFCSAGRTVVDCFLGWALDRALSGGEDPWQPSSRFLQISDRHRGLYSRDGRSGLVRRRRNRLPRLLPKRARGSGQRPGRRVDRPLLIAPAHGLTQGFLWPTMVFFLVDLMLGVSANLTKSILPGVAVHSLGLLIFFGVVWPQDRKRELIWTHGPDAWFWIHVTQAVVFGVLGILAFVRLAWQRSD